MAYDKLINSIELDNNLTSLANAIRTKSSTTAQMAFPNGFVNAIEQIKDGGEDGLVDIEYNITDAFSGAVENNCLVNYSTIAANTPYIFQLKRPIRITKNDVIKLTFTNKSATSAGYSRALMITAPFGEIAINDNFGMGTKDNLVELTYTEEQKDFYDVLALKIGPRHTTAWNNFNAKLNFYINNNLIF